MIGFALGLIVGVAVVSIVYYITRGTDKINDEFELRTKICDLKKEIKELESEISDKESQIEMHKNLDSYKEIEMDFLKSKLESLGYKVSLYGHMTTIVKKENVDDIK